MADPEAPSFAVYRSPPSGAAGTPYRVRLGLYLAFAVLALAVLLQGRSTLRLDEVRAAEAEILDLAGLQRTFTQQLGLAAALLAQAEPAERARQLQALDTLMRRSTDEALLMEDLLRRQFARSPVTARSVRPALEAWQAARERLWYHGSLLLHGADDAGDTALRRAAADVQDHTTPALAAAQQLSARLRAAAAQSAAGLTQQLRWGFAALLALLVALAVGVIEPTARALRRDRARLRRQAADLTARVQQQDSLSDSARADALTRLPNRAVVMERLQRAIEHARRHVGYGFAVLCIDFDRFKQVNDTLGHAAGDELLRQIARRLEQTLRPGDAMARMEAQVAARLGGDGFVVVLEGVNDAATAGAVAQRLLQELAEPYVVDASPVQSTLSIGVVLCTGVAAAAALPTADEVLRNADTAMYEAKRAGRARWVLFDDSMHERVLRALALEADLRRALKERELFVVYQPVVDLASQACVGVEALVRWRHPVRGLVLPIEFIGVAEECGLIDQLGAQVLDMACRQFVAWQQALGDAAPRQLSVNLSCTQLRRAALVDDVRAVLQAHGMAPERLQLEVTESLAAQDERVQTTLRELGNLGLTLALDDFGTGYSSLACLHQLPVDTVKVDRSFVEHAETVEHHRVLIEATIRVARTLGMTTVAEGIETEGQAALMLALECERGQGFLYSRPLEPEALEAWARARHDHTADTV